MRTIIALALVATTALASSAWAQSSLPAPTSDQIFEALRTPNRGLIHPALSAPGVRDSSLACGRGNRSDTPDPSMKNCGTRGIGDNGRKVAMALPPPVEVQHVQVENPCPAGSGLCAVPLTFTTASAQLSDEARKNLDNVADAVKRLQGTNFKILVEGHTDTVGSDASNQNLSVQRAWTAAQYIANKAAIPLDRLIVTGVGKRNLVVPTPDQVDEQRNRVVVLSSVPT